MRGTLVNSRNMKSFLPALGKEKIEDSDLIVGVIDEETDTACGVLWAEATDNSALDIRFIYVDEKYRNRGAGKKLLDFFLEIAEKISVRSITCSYIYNGENHYLYKLLDDAGFADVSEELREYAVKLGDFYIRNARTFDTGVVIVPVEELSRAEKSSITLFDIEGCREDISFVAFSGDTEVGGLIFGEISGMLELRYMDAQGPNREKALYLLYQEAFNRIDGQLDPETWVLVNASTPEQKATLDSLTDESAIVYRYYYMFSLML